MLGQLSVMLPAMAPTCEFLGFDQSYGSLVIDWLWERKSTLTETLVIVPTAQSGRRIRLGLAEKGGTLSPKVGTTGLFLNLADAAPQAVEILAWVEALEAVDDWSRYQAIFPTSPAEDAPGWSSGLAKTFVDLRATLQENGLTIQESSSKISSLENERWTQLAELENAVENLLRQWGYQSKSFLLTASSLNVPEDISRVVIAGVLDLPKVVTAFLKKSDLEIDVLLPGDESSSLDEWGRPDLTWNQHEIPWPENGSVTLTGNPQQQADLAVSKVAEGDFEPNEVALASGDDELPSELVRSFTRADWSVHDPGASLPSPVAGWLTTWRSFLQKPGVKEAVDLLSFDQSKKLTSGIRSIQVKALSGLRDSFLTRSFEDIERAQILIEERLQKETSENKRKHLEIQKENSEIAANVMEEFMTLRARFLSQGFHATMRSLHHRIDREGEAGIATWLEATADVAEKVERSPIFWIDLLLHDLGPVAEQAPDDRSHDVQGWLELLHEPAPHLIVCGVNEGRIPGRASSDTWLPESARELLELPCDQSRAARDAFLLHTLISMRAEGGRVDLIVGKSSHSGDVLLPSRLLLSSKGALLAERVKQLFAEVEPADAGVAWHLEEHWKWRPRQMDRKARMSVTDFSKYLGCPFRYYLERVVGMDQPEPERAEWNHRDFGNIMHEVLENWGRDEVVRDSADPVEIETWLLSDLDKLVKKHFGDSIPLAVSLQVESMRLRLGWFAKVQTKTRAEGWRIVEVEKDFELTIDDITVKGQIDRIDRNEKGQIRVLDYKTSKEASEVEKAHTKKYLKEPPEHLRHEAVQTPDGKIWTNLQVPFYAAALGDVVAAGYFALGQDASNVKIMSWEGFGEEQEESAMKCARWIVGQVRDQVFLPPVEKPQYDEFVDLAYGRPLAESIIWEGGAA